MAFPRPIEAVVFDLDGLLIDSETLVRAAVMQAATQIGRELPMEVYARVIGRSDVAYLEVMTEHFGSGVAMERFLEIEAEEVERAFAAGVALKAGAAELVEHLAEMGLPLALATSSPRDYAERQLGAHGLRSRFTAVVGREDVDQHKPHPAPYLEAARRLGVPPSACLALEDSHNGVRAAHAAGMMTVMVPDLLEATEEMEGLCVHLAETLHEVVALLTAN